MRTAPLTPRPPFNLDKAPLKDGGRLRPSGRYAVLRGGREGGERPGGLAGVAARRPERKQGRRRQAAHRESVKFSG